MRKPDLAFLLSIVLAGGCGAPPPRTELGKQAPAATVETARAAPGVVEESIRSFGSVEFDPGKTRSISMVSSGLVEQIMVRPGEAVQAETPLLRLGPLPSSGIEVEEARINLDFARQKLERLERMRSRKLATNEMVESARKEVESSRAILSGLGVDGSRAPRLIRAPFEGIVVRVLISSGSILRPGEDAILLAPADGLVVRAGFEPEDAIRLRPGMPVVISPVFRADGEESAHATLSRLHRVVDPKTQLVEALIRPAADLPWMIAGVKVEIAVVLRSAPDALRIPREALLPKNGEIGVFVIEKGIARWRLIHPGIEDGKWVAIRSGLAAGEEVVTRGRTSLSDGMMVGTSGGKR